MKGARWRRSLAALLAAAALCSHANTVEEVALLPTDGPATLPVLFSHDDARPPALLAVLFSGGAGAVGLLQRGIPQPGGNFLVRSRGLFVAEGVATAVIDVRSDRAGLSDADRMGAAHADDVRRVVAELRRRHGAALPLYLVGTSRGTVSAAYAGAALGSDIAGVVLTSTVFNASRGGPGVSGFDFSRLQVPLLFVHHVDDACSVTPYFMAQRRAAGHALVSVHGGDPPRSDPCEPFSAHGYLGVEAPTVHAIVAWMRGDGVAANVGQDSLR